LHYWRIYLIRKRGELLGSVEAAAISRKLTGG
jgi:hypothetical protein